jgi:hypothetical protein
MVIFHSYVSLPEGRWIHFTRGSWYHRTCLIRGTDFFRAPLKTLISIVKKMSRTWTFWGSPRLIEKSWSLPNLWSVTPPIYIYYRFVWHRLAEVSPNLIVNIPHGFMVITWWYTLSAGRCWGWRGRPIKCRSRSQGYNLGTMGDRLGF